MTRRRATSAVVPGLLAATVAAGLWGLVSLYHDLPLPLLVAAAVLSGGFLGLLFGWAWVRLAHRRAGVPVPRNWVRRGVAALRRPHP